MDKKFSIPSDKNGNQIMTEFFPKYFNELNRLVMSYDEEKLDTCVKLIRQVQKNKKKVLILGMEEVQQSLVT